MSLAALVPAAGASTRFGGAERKPFTLLNGEPVLVRTLKRLARVAGVRECILVVHPEDLECVQGPLAPVLEAAAGLPVLTVAGGASRAESVWNGLQVLPADCDLVLVHDAARPLFSIAVAGDLVKAASKRGAAVPVTPLTDTVKRIEADRILETPRRRGLVRVQTPQVFQSDLLIEAYEYALRTGGLSDAVTDDASLVEAYGKEVAAVLGDEYNIKLTTPRDFRMAEAILRAELLD